MNIPYWGEVKVKTGEDTLLGRGKSKNFGEFTLLGRGKTKNFGEYTLLDRVESLSEFI